MLQRFFVLEFDITKSLELVGLFITNETDGADLKFVKHEVHVTLDDTIGQVAHISCKWRLFGDRTVPTTSAATAAFVTIIPAR